MDGGVVGLVGRRAFQAERGGDGRQAASCCFARAAAVYIACVAKEGRPLDQTVASRKSKTKPSGRGIVVRKKKTDGLKSTGHCLTKPSMYVWRYGFIYIPMWYPHLPFLSLFCPASGVSRSAGERVKGVQKREPARSRGGGERRLVGANRAATRCDMALPYRSFDAANIIMRFGLSQGRSSGTLGRVLLCRPGQPW